MTASRDSCLTSSPAARPCAPKVIQLRTPSRHNQLHPVLISNQAPLESPDEFPRVSARDVYWKCWFGGEPLIIDARPSRDFDVYRVFGAINIPSDAPVEAFADIPRNRPIFIHGASGIRGEKCAVALARRMAQLDNAPSVSIMLGGPSEIRLQGFFYINDVEAEEALNTLKAEEKKAAEEAKKAAEEAKKTATVK